MKIIVVDDDREELKKAVEAVEAAGHEAIAQNGNMRAYEPSFWELMAEADGVITDLYFSPERGGTDAIVRYAETAPPMGLVVALHALHIGKPVVICTSGNHHGPELSFVFDSYVSANSWNIGFGWEEHKDWATAVKMLERGVVSPWGLK